MKKANVIIFILCTLLIPTQQSKGNESENPNNRNTIRLAVVNTPDYSGLLDYLLADFRKESGYTVVIYSGSDVFNRARRGESDIVISHYGKSQVEKFVREGYGSWPKMVFSNQAVIIGPKNDPARIKGLKSASEALLKISRSKSKFIDNPAPVVTYLTEILWNLIGQPDKNDWFVRTTLDNAHVAKMAEQNNGYFIWGVHPFLRYQEKSGAKMEIMVSDDPILQRAMSSMLVSSEKFPSLNKNGAKALQDYLLSPKVQARVAQFRVKGIDKQLWWPAGRNN